MFYHLLLCFVDLKQSLSKCRECGSICSTKYDSQEEGKLYPLLRKEVNCDNIMHRMAFCPFKVFRPPLRVLPNNLIKDFTMDGYCRIGKQWYFDESALSERQRSRPTDIDALLSRDKQGININKYKDKNVLKPALRWHLYAIKNKHVAVIGTVHPWVEAILINLGVSQVTTIEYNKLDIKHSQVHVITPYKFAEKFLNRTADFETFDAAFSYSSIEHSGLGRYGDPLMPYGDMEALAQIWCATKPGGILFLALPMTPSRKDCILQFNARRRYGYIRMQHLTANWKVLDEINMFDGHFLYVLQKVE